MWFNTPADIKHLHNICTTSAQRLRRWSNIVQMLCKCFVLLGLEELLCERQPNSDCVSGRIMTRGTVRNQ